MKLVRALVRFTDRVIKIDYVICFILLAAIVPRLCIVFKGNTS